MPTVLPSTLSTIVSALVAADAPPSQVTAGDSAWVMVAAVLVLFMTIPGLALFYAGLVRTKNVLSIFAQCLAVTCLVSVLWALAGYSLAFDGHAQVAGVLNWNSFIGGMERFGLLGLSFEVGHPAAPKVPEAVFCLFQLAFAVITPALLVGAFAERIRFSALLWIAGLWLFVVYIPVAHWMWCLPGAWFGSSLGVLDLAGGTAVEVNSGIAGLVCALMVGRRAGYPKEAMLPHNTVLCITGACLLWVGWFGFNAGSACAMDAVAARAAIATHLAAATAGLTWLVLEWRLLGKPTATGMATGAVGGLVAITPACGAVGPLGALAVGAAAGVACFLAVTRLKKRLGYDDTLDVFGVHGVGGMVGLLLTGVFCAPALGGAGFGAGHTGIASQFATQGLAMGITIVWSAAGTWLVLKLTDLITGLRVPSAIEERGSDLTVHGEVAYNP